jgi:hypothetical protein
MSMSIRLLPYLPGDHAGNENGAITLGQIPVGRELAMGTPMETCAPSYKLRGIAERGFQL